MQKSISESSNKRKVKPTNTPVEFTRTRSRLKFQKSVSVPRDPEIIRKMVRRFFHSIDFAPDGLPANLNFKRGNIGGAMFMTDPYVGMITSASVVILPHGEQTEINVITRVDLMPGQMLTNSDYEFCKAELEELAQFLISGKLMTSRSSALRRWVSVAGCLILICILVVPFVAAGFALALLPSNVVGLTLPVFVLSLIVMVLVAKKL